MFGLDPLSRPVAIAEILLLLAFAAFVGWLLGRLVLAGRVGTLRSAIDDKKAELEKCRSEKASGHVDIKSAGQVPFKPMYPYEADEIETPQLFVSADPLLPAYSHDDTPAPLVNDELAAEINDTFEPVAADTPTTLVAETTTPMAVETPQLFVSADPLLPAYSYDGTPAPLVNDEIAAQINDTYETGIDEPSTPVTLTTEAQTPEENSQLFVSADPLLPIYSHDDTPAPLVDDELAAEISNASTPLVGEKLSLAGSAFELPDEEEVATPASVVEDRESIVLNRIATRVSEVNFERIGRATAAEADDLKDIVGVGPFLERKLHSIGIYTFRQIANFTKEDINKVNEIIEFFPGRIEGDNWVGQSKAFYERKYGSKK